MRLLQRRVLTCLVLLALSAARPAAADEAGVTADTILFGQAAALEGPSSALGQGMRQGILAAFAQINAQGGIHGRRLRLVSRDDGYDPDRSAVQTRRLIEQDRVFALIGAVGTPTAIAAMPIAQASNVPFIGAFSGAEFLRTADMTNVINLRPSYAVEAEAWIKHLTEDLDYKRIAIFYQDDSFGRDGLKGVKLALEKRGLELAAEGTFERNTNAVSSALKTIRRVDPEAVVMVGTYGPCAEFIKLAHQRDFNPTFVNISFVGASALSKKLGADGTGVIVSQVVPFPWDTSLELVADYQAALKALDPALTPDFVSLEGYQAGRLTAAALELAGAIPTRAGLLQIINNVGRFDIGGNPVTFGAKAGEAPSKVFLTAIQPDGSFRPIDHLSMRPTPESRAKTAPLRSTLTEQPERTKSPDPRGEAKARVQDCGSSTDPATMSGDPCDLSKPKEIKATVIAARPANAGAANLPSTRAAKKPLRSNPPARLAKKMSKPSKPGARHPSAQHAKKPAPGRAVSHGKPRMQARLLSSTSQAALPDCGCAPPPV